MADQEIVGRIASLTDEQAARALLLLYDAIPEQYWDEGRPSWDAVGMLVQEAEEDAPAEIRSFMSQLGGSSQGALRGELARLLLRRVAEDNHLAPFLADVLSPAEAPQMFLPPEALALAVLVLGSLNFEAGGAKFHVQYNPGLFLDKLTNFVKALPPDILSKLAH